MRSLSGASPNALKALAFHADLRRCQSAGVCLAKASGPSKRRCIAVSAKEGMEVAHMCTPLL